MKILPTTLRMKEPDVARLKRIHINMHNIRSNRKNDTRLPVVTVKDYKSNTYGDQAIIYGADGQEAARVVYSPDKPLSCGATVFIETRNEVKVLNYGDEDSQ